MMSTSESEDAKMPKKSKMPKGETKDAKATLVIPAFGSKDAKMAS